MEKLTEKIDLYLNNSLPDAEMKELKIRIEQDEAFAKEVKLQEKATQLLEAHAWLITKEKVAKLNRKKPFNMIPWLKLAAIFIGIVTFSYFFMNYKYSNSQLYSIYFSPYPDRITTMGNVEEDKIKAMEFYNKEEYGAAADLFYELRENGRVDDQMILYEVISLTEIGKPAEALVLLEKEFIQANLKEAFAWQRILCLLANEQGEKAYEKVLLYLQKDYQYQRSKSERLKEDLESIWR